MDFIINIYSFILNDVAVVAVAVAAVAVAAARA
jgi:hypothetical protein